MIKKCLLVLAALWLSATALWAQRPSWVSTHPVDADTYIGVGAAPAADADHVAKATQAALTDIAGQIARRVEVQSFLQTIDADGRSRELFEEKVHQSMTAHIEGHQLDDSYTDGATYYVRYSLDKKRYATQLEAHRKQAIQQGLDYYRQGEAAMASNSLALAAQHFAKGLEVVEPWTFADLTTTVAGKTFDVAGELYRAYVAVFDGLAITVSDLNVDGEAYKRIAKPLAACLSRDGVVVPNVKLAARFVKGAGEVTPPVATDYNGTSEFYVTNITSRDAIQELRITIDDSFTAALPASYRTLLQKQTWPEGKIVIQLSAQPVTACIHVSEDDLPGCSRQVSALLANNHFTMTEDPDDARVFIDMTTSLAIGGTVQGELYDLNECHVSLVLKFYDTATQRLLLDYNVDRLRVLAPKNKGVEQVKAACVRELMKRVKAELPQQLKKINL